MKFPYTYISCPCSGITSSLHPHNDTNHDSEDEEQENTFNPRSPRANFSLYPMEHLLYCEDCHTIRCPRCVAEEVVCWYCPSCLFEVTSMMVKSDGNRCQRNCFDCPVCVAPLSIQNISPSDTSSATGPFILACEYCHWNTLDINVQFDRPTKLAEKLAVARKEARTKQIQESTSSGPPQKPDPEETFTSLKNFMSLQISSASSTNPLLTPGGSYNYDSPSSLARIMSLYTGLGSYGKKNTSKSAPMRESADASEGLHALNPQHEADEIKRLREEGYNGTTSLEQRSTQRTSPRSVADLWPVPTLLRTKRAKRCRQCRHILVKPEPKVSSTRYRIRLIALTSIPTITLKPLPPPSSSTTSLDLHNIPPLRASQFLLTLRNPLFDPAKITLATPTHTPGKHSHRVTILCPQFDIGANVDAWDEALATGDASRPLGKSLSSTKPSKGDAEGGMRVAEAGKVWDKGRNWTTVVVEVVCAEVGSGDGGSGNRGGNEKEDDDVLEIPVFVRTEFTVDPPLESRMAAGNPKGEAPKEKRELAYWVIVGVGRVGRVRDR